MTEQESMEVAVANPFSNQTRAMTSRSAARAEEQRAIAEVQAALVVAKANPRDEVRAYDRIRNACQRITLAESAVYNYARGGAEVTGPSIRLAEAIAQQWGNLQFGMRELDQDNGVSTVQAFAWDVETNTRREVTFQVRHERHTKNGVKRLTDPRDIYETVANQGARRVRACVLAVIPGDVVEGAVRECEATLRAKADVTPEGVAKLLAAFAQYGVTKQQIEARIQRKIDAIQPAQIVSLKKIYVSLRDGMSSVDEWFPAESKVGATAATAGPDAPPPQSKVEESGGYGDAGEPATPPPPKAKRQPKGEAAKPSTPPPTKPADVPPPNNEAAEHDAAADAQAKAAAASPPAGTVAVPLAEETMLVLPWQSIPEDSKASVLALKLDDAGETMFEGWTGKAWAPVADAPAAHAFAHKQLQKVLTQHCKRARMDRGSALAWAQESLKLDFMPAQFAELELQQLVALARSLHGGD